MQKKRMSTLLALALSLTSTMPMSHAVEVSLPQHGNLFHPQKMQSTTAPMLVFIGQDKEEMDTYVEALANEEDFILGAKSKPVKITTTGQLPLATDAQITIRPSDHATPAGFMMYTNLDTLEGMDQLFEGDGANQAGEMDFQYWSEAYPGTAMNIGVWASDKGQLERIIQGELDDNIKQFAHMMKASNKPVFVRFGYEFDGPWNVYEPETYVEAYKRFVDVIRAEGADNVAFVWHSAAFFKLGETNIWHNAEGAAKGDGFDKAKVQSYIDGTSELTRSYEEWYPGDAYVDWVGMSWFHWQYEYQEKIAEIRREELAQFAQAHNKPIMLAETAPKAYWQGNDPWNTNKEPLLEWFEERNGEDNPNWIYSEEKALIDPLYGTPLDYTGDSWDNWYQPVFDFIEKYDVGALCYINQDWNNQAMWAAQGDWGDTRVQEDEELFQRWLIEMAQPYTINAVDDVYDVIGFEPNVVPAYEDLVIPAKTYTDKPQGNAEWHIADYEKFIGFNGEWTWVDYTITIDEPGNYDVKYTYASAIQDAETGQSIPTQTTAFVNAVSQGTVDLPSTGDWITFGEGIGQTLAFPYEGSYTLRIQAPKGGLNLQHIELVESEAHLVSGSIDEVQPIDALAYSTAMNIVDNADCVGFGAPNASVTYRINVQESGEYQFKYQTGSEMPAGNPTLTLAVDGVEKETTELPVDGWVNFENAPTSGPTVQLEKGIQTVTLTSPTAYLNLQSFSIVPTTLYKHGESYDEDTSKVTYDHGPFVSYEPGDYSTYVFTIDEAARYELLINYGTLNAPGIEGTTIDVALNGNKVDTVALASTGGWTNWKEQGLMVLELEGGDNTLRFTATNGALNIESLKLVPTDKTVDLPKVGERKWFDAAPSYAFDVEAAGDYMLYAVADTAGSASTITVQSNDEAVLEHTVQTTQLAQVALGELTLAAGDQTLVLDGEWNALEGIELVRVEAPIILDAVYPLAQQGMALSEDGGHRLAEANGTLTHELAVAQPGYYNISLNYANWGAEGVPVVVETARHKEEATLGPTGGSLTKYGVGPVHLIEGTGTLTLTCPEGGIALDRITLTPFEPIAVPETPVVTVQMEAPSDSRGITAYPTNIGMNEWSYSEYIVDVERAGLYNLDVSYAIGNMGDRVTSPLRVELDGKVIEDTMLDTTGDWGNFAHYTLENVRLKKGLNVLKLSADQGGMNLDALQLKGVKYDALDDDNNSGTPGSGSTGSTKPDKEESGSKPVVIVANPIDETLQVDIPSVQGHWSESAVVTLAKRGIKLTEEGEVFVPDAVMSRGSVASLLVQLVTPQEPITTSPFRDSQSGTAQDAAILQLYTQGLMAGYEDGTFQADRQMTRVEFMVVLHRILQGIDTTLETQETTPFADTEAIPDWAQQAVAQLQAYGLVVGDEKGNFNPDQPITQAQACVMVERVLARLEE